MPDNPKNPFPPISCISEWRHFETTGSTNQDALQWLAEGAPDQSLISADHQSQGRGRANRFWVTHADAGLAFSLIIRPESAEIRFINRFTALAALALVRWLKKVYHVKACIKWPNDVLINGKKVAGILVETEWEGAYPLGLVIGVGINVMPASVPKEILLHYPASSLVQEIGLTMERDPLMWGVLQEMCALRKHLQSHAVIRSWNRSLAYKHQTVKLHHPDKSVEPVRIIRVNLNGNLLVKGEQGRRFEVIAGELDLTYNQIID